MTEPSLPAALQPYVHALSLLVALTALSGQSVLSWPPEHGGRGRLLQVMAAAAAALALTFVRVPLGHGPNGLPLSADLSSVPVLTLALQYGLRAGLLSGLPLAGYLTLFCGAAAVAPLAGLLGAVGCAAVVSRATGTYGAQLRGAWWVAPLICAVQTVALALAPGGLDRAEAAGLGMFALNLAGVWVARFVLRGRTTLLRQNRQYRRQARLDPLTRLANRRMFDEDIAYLGEADHLLLLDIDHFKSVNDRFGHQAGDEVLRDLGRLIAQTIRPGDRAYRYGGEELAVVYRGVTAEQAEKAAERLRATVAARHFEALQGGGLTISGGLATGEARLTPKARVARADRALYRAKDAGRDRIELAAGDPHSTRTTLLGTRLFGGPSGHSAGTTGARARSGR